MHLELTIERSLELVESTASSSSRVGPVNFVSFTDFHTDAVLPVVFLCELFIAGVIVMASVSSTDFLITSKVTVAIFVVGAVAIFVEFSKRKMFTSKMPVNIDGAHLSLEVRSLDRFVVDGHVSLITLGDISTGLGAEGLRKALDVINGDLGSVARIWSRRWLHSGKASVESGRGVDIVSGRDCRNSGRCTISKLVAKNNGSDKGSNGDSSAESNRCYGKGGWDALGLGFCCKAPKLV
jgi:hypothetical protein